MSDVTALSQPEEQDGQNGPPESVTPIPMTAASSIAASVQAFADAILSSVVTANAVPPAMLRAAASTGGLAAAAEAAEHRAMLLGGAPLNRAQREARFSAIGQIASLASPYRVAIDGLAVALDTLVLRGMEKDLYLCYARCQRARARQTLGAEPISKAHLYRWLKRYLGLDWVDIARALPDGPHMQQQLRDLAPWRFQEGERVRHSTIPGLRGIVTERVALPELGYVVELFRPDGRTHPTHIRDVERWESDPAPLMPYEHPRRIEL